MITPPVRGRGRPRREEAGAEILDAARGLLLAAGYRALSLDEVARRARTAKSSIYRRWKSKAALVAEIIRTETTLRDDLDRDSALQAFEQLMNGQYGAAVAALVGEAFESDDTREIVASLLAPYRQGGDDRIAGILFGTLLR